MDCRQCKGYSLCDLVNEEPETCPIFELNPDIKCYETIFTFTTVTYGVDSNEAYDDAFSNFSCDHHVADAFTRQVDTEDDVSKITILRDEQLDILLRVLEDTRYTNVDTLNDETVGMDEQFEIRKCIDEIDEIVKILKEARA